MIWNPSSAGVDELGRSSSTTSWACDWVLFMGSWKPETSKGFCGIKRCGLVWTIGVLKKQRLNNSLNFGSSDYSVCFCCWHFIAFVKNSTRSSNCCLSETAVNSRRSGGQRQAGQMAGRRCRFFSPKMSQDVPGRDVMFKCGGNIGMFP